MGKRVEAGIDVSKDVLDVAVRRDGERLETARFDNEASSATPPASGALHHARGIEVMTPIRAR
jgi:transposase